MYAQSPSLAWATSLMLAAHAITSPGVFWLAISGKSLTKLGAHSATVRTDRGEKCSLKHRPKQRRRNPKTASARSRAADAAQEIAQGGADAVKALRNSCESKGKKYRNAGRAPPSGGQFGATCYNRGRTAAAQERERGKGGRKQSESCGFWHRRSRCTVHGHIERAGVVEPTESIHRTKE